MTLEQLRKANSLSRTINECEAALKRIKAVDVFFYNSSKADRSVYDETISKMIVVVRSSNGKEIIIDLPEDTSIGRELITTLENFYREKEKRVQKEFDDFGGAENDNNKSE